MYPKLPTRLGHFEFKTLRSPTVVRLGIGDEFFSQESPKKFQLPQATPEALLFFFGADWERGNREKFLPPRIFSLASPSTRFLAHLTGKSRSSFRPWRYRSLVTFHVATSSNPEPQVKSETLTYVQRPRLVGPSVRVLRKPSPKRGRAGSASDWQALEECARKHLKSS